MRTGCSRRTTPPPHTPHTPLQPPHRTLSRTCNHPHSHSAEGTSSWEDIRSAPPPRTTPPPRNPRTARQAVHGTQACTCTPSRSRSPAAKMSCPDMRGTWSMLRRRTCTRRTRRSFQSQHRGTSPRDTHCTARLAVPRTQACTCTPPHSRSPGRMRSWTDTGGTRSMLRLRTCMLRTPRRRHSQNRGRIPRDTPSTRRSTPPKQTHFDHHLDHHFHPPRIQDRTHSPRTRPQGRVGSERSGSDTGRTARTRPRNIPRSTGTSLRRTAPPRSQRRWYTPTNQRCHTRLRSTPRSTDTPRPHTLRAPPRRSRRSWYT